jgi:hypothetical protein
VDAVSSSAHHAPSEHARLIELATAYTRARAAPTPNINLNGNNINININANAKEEARALTALLQTLVNRADGTAQLFDGLTARAARAGGAASSDAARLIRALCVGAAQPLSLRHLEKRVFLFFFFFFFEFFLFSTAIQLFRSLLWQRLTRATATAAASKRPRSSHTS